MIQPKKGIHTQDTVDAAITVLVAFRILVHWDDGLKIPPTYPFRIVSVVFVPVVLNLLYVLPKICIQVIKV